MFIWSHLQSIHSCTFKNAIGTKRISRFARKHCRQDLWRIRLSVDTWSFEMFCIPWNTCSHRLESSWDPTHPARFSVLPGLTHPLQSRKCLRSRENAKTRRNTRIPRVRNPRPTTTAVTTMFEMRHNVCHVIDHRYHGSVCWLLYFICRIVIFFAEYISQSSPFRNLEVNEQTVLLMLFNLYAGDLAVYNWTLLTEPAVYVLQYQSAIYSALLLNLGSQYICLQLFFKDCIYFFISFYFCIKIFSCDMLSVSCLQGLRENWF